MTNPEPPLVPLRLFDQHLRASHGMSSVQSLDDLKREVAIRYPHTQPNIDQPTICPREPANMPKFDQLWPQSQWGEFSYKTNDWGFRDDSIQLDVDSCYYGCSQTYAMGVPKAGRYGEQLDQIIGGTSNNFGIMGIGIEETLQLFMATSNIIRMKRAVFNFPDIHRHSSPFNDDRKSGNVLYYNLMFNKWFEREDLYVNHRKTINETYDAHFRLPPAYMFDRMRNIIQTIAYIGALKGIDIVMTAWSKHTYEALMVFAQYPGVTWRLPEWVSPQTDIARDDLHFGVETHGAMARNMARVL